jgi:hypothetical protein
MLVLLQVMVEQQQETRLMIMYVEESRIWSLQLRFFYPRDPLSIPYCFVALKVKGMVSRFLQTPR